MQQGQPIAYASRTMTDTECCYAQIGKETLVIVFALERFNQYTYGRTILVQSDHQPIEAIMKKPLHKAPMRLQRMMLHMQKYAPIVSWIPGNKLYLADTLSRASVPATGNQNTKFQNVNAIELVDLQPIDITKIQKATREDPTIQTIHEIVVLGEPDRKGALPACIHPYWSVRNDILFDKIFLLKGETIIVPDICRKRIKKSLHDEAYFGSDSCLRRARNTVYWFGVSAEL